MTLTAQQVQRRGQALYGGRAGGAQGKTEPKKVRKSKRSGVTVSVEESGVIRLSIRCNGRTHTIRISPDELAGARLRVHDHDLEAEEITQALGGQASRCVDVVAELEEFREFLDDTDNWLQWLRLGVHCKELVRSWEEIGVLSADEASEWLVFTTVTGAGGWRRAGVKDPSVAFLWSATSFSRKDAVAWHLAGWSIDDALEWKAFGSSDPGAIGGWRLLGVRRPEDVRPWREAGVNDNHDAGQWHRIGVTRPEEVAAWLTAGAQDGEDARAWQAVCSHHRRAAAVIPSWRARGWTAKEAAQWTRAGVSLDGVDSWVAAGVRTPAQLHSWLGIGVRRPEDIAGFQHHGITDASGLNRSSAEAWGKAGVRSLADFEKWQELGVTDPEVAQDWATTGEVTGLDEVRYWHHRGQRSPQTALRALKDSTLLPAGLWDVRKRWLLEDGSPTMELLSPPFDAHYLAVTTERHFRYFSRRASRDQASHFIEQDFDVEGWEVSRRVGPWFEPLEAEPRVGRGQG